MMKRISNRAVSLAASCLALFGSVAASGADEKIVANNRFKDNTFISTGAGVDMNYTPGLGLGFNARGSFVMDVSAGRWFTPSIGFRLGYQGLNFSDWESADVLLPGANAVPGIHGGEELYKVRTEYDYLHADLLWNLRNTFSGLDYNRKVDFIPYLHLGYQWLYNSFNEPRSLLKRDYAGGLGLITSVRLYDKLSVYADLRATGSVRHMTDGTDATNKMGIAFYGMAGLTYDLCRTDWDRAGGNRHRGYILNKAFDNTFIGISGGVNSYFTLGETFHWNAKPETVFGINAGKWFTPTVGARVGIETSTLSHYCPFERDTNGYLTRKEAVFAGQDCSLYSFAFDYIHGDLMWDAGNTFFGYSPKSFYHFIPYISFGAGLSVSENRNKVFKKDFFAGAGIINSVNITRDLSLNVDARATFLSGREYGNALRSDAVIGSVQFGVSYAVNNNPWKAIGRNVVERKMKPELPDVSGPILRGTFRENSFITLFTGVDVAFGEDGTIVNPGLEFDYGKWFSPLFGFRAGLSGIDGLYAHADLIFNVINAVKGSCEPRRFDCVPYVGLGPKFAFERGNTHPEYLGTFSGVDAGLLTSVAIGKFAQANLDLRMSHAAGVTSAECLLGLSYALGSPDWLIGKPKVLLGEKERRENVERFTGYIMNLGLFDNSFISYSAGVNSFDFEGVGAAVDLSAGKWFSPAIGLRLGYQGRKTSRGSGDLYHKLNTDFYHADLMWNPVATLLGYKVDRVYEPALYMESGILNLKDPNGDKLGTEFTWGVGFLENFHVSERLALTLDLKGVMLKDEYTRTNPNGNMSIYASALAGVTYAFGRTAWNPGVAYGEKEAERNEDRERRWALSTNLLGYADFLTLNLELQHAVGRHWSLSMQGKSNNLILRNGEESQLMDRKSVSSVGVKYWPWYVYCGLWAKAFAQTEAYSCSNLTSGMEFEKGNRYGGGVALGYSLIVNKWFNLDFGLGVWAGYSQSETFSYPELNQWQTRAGRGFVDFSEASISAMFVF